MIFKDYRKLLKTSNGLRSTGKPPDLIARDRAISGSACTLEVAPSRPETLGRVGAEGADESTLSWRPSISW